VPLPDSARDRPIPSLSLAAPRPTGQQLLAWATVRAALALYGVGSVLILLSLVIGAGLASDHEPTGPRIILSVLAVWAMLAGAVLALAGMFTASAAPEGLGVKEWAMACVGCLVIGMLAFLIVFLRAESRESRADPGKGWAYLAIAALLLAKVFFTAFLWRVAMYFRDPTLAGNVLVYLVVDVGLALITFALQMRESTASAVSGPLNPLGVAKLWNWIIIGILIWSVVLVFMVRDRITRALLAAYEGTDDEPLSRPSQFTKRDPDGNLPGPNPPPQ
jgi:hypothetical protein